MEQTEFLEKNVFVDLKNENDGFDERSIHYFSESDFEIVLKRVERMGLGIYGIEPWLNGKFYDVFIHEDFTPSCHDPNWYQEAFSNFRKQHKDLQYAATYHIPFELLKI